MSKKMGFQKRFKMSQSAHKRLDERHHSLYLKTKKDRHYICQGYHASVYARQKSLGRILTSEEKEKLYKASEYFFYN